MTFLERLKQSILLFDGAMGTQIQGMDICTETWAGKHGCSEILNISAPHIVKEIHRRYLKAGADVIETNSFGANSIVLQEYALEDQLEELNTQAAKIAVEAAVEFSSPEKPRFVAGSMGPGTKLISLGQIDFDSLYNSYFRQAAALYHGGVDLLIIETCQDLLQAKCAVIAAQDACQNALPIGVSVTIETTGSMLIGSSVAAIATALAPYDLAFFGLNCATGPDKMRPYLAEAKKHFNGPLFCMPNAGMPENINGQTVYSMAPQRFSELVKVMAEQEGLAIIGGCCGTSPDYIHAAAEALQGLSSKQGEPQGTPHVSSLFSEESLKQEPAPFFIGERTNTNGSKLFRQKLLADNWDGIVDVAKEQAHSGAHALDLCVAYTGRDEIRDMCTAVEKIVTQVDLPLVIDSTDPAVLEAALKRIGGRAIINSINLEDGEQKAKDVCALAKRYGAALIALTIDENGMAKNAETKVAIAQRIYEIAVNEIGLKPQDLLFDALTFTLGSGDEELKTAAIETLEGIRRIKAQCPGSLTVLGVSNISFGLSPYSREILNSVFLAEAILAGLDAAIINVKKLIPLHEIHETALEQAFNLIYNKEDNALFTFIEFFENTKHAKNNEGTVTMDATDKLKHAVLHGRKSDLQSISTELLETHKATEIINTILIPAMKEVGKLFGEGKMQLPFVLQSAEVMKTAMDYLQAYIDKADNQTAMQIVLATVKGDVHDIGKNLVDIILSNNGYIVHNIGIKAELNAILQKVKETTADAIGLSGLLVKSTAIMKEYIEEMKFQGVDIPVLLGGAALTEKFVKDDCDPLLDSPVIYCKDAFDGLAAMNALQDKRLKSCYAGSSALPNQEKIGSQKKETIKIIKNIPNAPFWGSRVEKDPCMDSLFSLINKKRLFQIRWGYNQGSLDRETYNTVLQTDAEPLFAELKDMILKEKYIEPRFIYGYYRCRAKKDSLYVYPDEACKHEPVKLHFPRQAAGSHLCLTDYFRRESKEKNLIAMQFITIGERPIKKAQDLYAQNEYKKYLLFHGLCVELTEALADYVQLEIADGLQLASKNQGKRFSFGYPACPDLAGNEALFKLLHADRIGVTIGETGQIFPELSTAAFFVHHPQARYFRA